MAHAAGQIHNLDDITAYLRGGHGALTLVSRETGKRYTFRFGCPRGQSASAKNGAIYTSVLVGPNNSSDYIYLGAVLIRDGQIVHLSRKGVSDDPHTAKATKALQWFVRALQTHRDSVLEQIEVWHEGRCGMCGRELTTPESIERGIGPVCAARAAVA